MTTVTIDQIVASADAKAKEAKQRDDGRDKWATPRAVYEQICNIWQVVPTVDVCASLENSKCPAFISEEMDALRQNWVDLAKACGVAPIFWMNPPYSQPLLSLFIEKAIEESKQGATVIFLLPDSTDQTWFDSIGVFPHTFWRDPANKPGNKTHRIKFEPPAGIKPSSPRFGNVHGVIRQAASAWSQIL